MNTQYFVQPKHPEELFKYLPTDLDQCKGDLAFQYKLLTQAEQKGDEFMIEQILKLLVHLRYRYIILSKSDDCESIFYKKYYERFFSNLIFTSQKRVVSVNTLEPISIEPIPLPWIESTEIIDDVEWDDVDFAEMALSFPSVNELPEVHFEESLLTFKSVTEGIPYGHEAFACECVEDYQPLVTSTVPSDLYLITSAHVQLGPSDDYSSLLVKCTVDTPSDDTRISVVDHTQTMNHTEYLLENVSEFVIPECSSHLAMCRFNGFDRRSLSLLNLASDIQGLWHYSTTLVFVYESKQLMLQDLALRQWLMKPP